MTVLQVLAIFGGMLLVSAYLYMRSRQGKASPAPRTQISPRQGEPTTDIRIAETLKALEVDIFWCRLLEPLREMSTLERDAAFRELGSRPQQHPSRGKRFVDRSTLQQQYQRTRKMTLASLEERVQELTTSVSEPGPSAER